RDAVRQRTSCRADPPAVSGQLPCPPTGNYAAVSEQFVAAVVTPAMEPSHLARATGPLTLRAALRAVLGRGPVARAVSPAPRAAETDMIERQTPTLAAGQANRMGHEQRNAAVRVRPSCHPVDLHKGYHTASRGQTRGILRPAESAPLTRRGRAGARSTGWHEGPR
ncbi:MAG: hypothetical protein ACRDRP_19855, partial [Pseudonocardiaceae bacterium]